MQDDRELLEMAAKAAGLWDAANNCIDVPRNPLADDGDALRLAVKLNIQVTPGTYGKQEACAYHPDAAGEEREHVHYQQDLYAATRRAIVRAAAALGKEQP